MKLEMQNNVNENVLSLFRARKRKYYNVINLIVSKHGFECFDTTTSGSLRGRS